MGGLRVFEDMFGCISSWYRYLSFDTMDTTNSLPLSLHWFEWIWWYLMWERAVTTPTGALLQWLCILKGIPIILWNVFSTNCDENAKIWVHFLYGYSDRYSLCIVRKSEVTVRLHWPHMSVVYAVSGNKYKNHPESHSSASQTALIMRWGCGDPHM